MFKRFSRQISIIIALLMMTAMLPYTASAAWEGDEISARTTNPDIRFGVFSDTHVTVPQQVWTNDTLLKNMMSMYKTMDSGLDAFAMTGDIIYQTKRDECAQGQYDYVLAAMNEYFDCDNTTDAVVNPDKTKLIWAMGNHEVSLGATDPNGADADIIAANKTEYKNALGHEPCYKTEVNGFTFITAEPYDYLNNYCNSDKSMSEMERKVKNWILEAEAADPVRPIFYLQHEPMDDTFFQSNPRGTRNSEEFRSFMEGHSRVIVLSAHHHLPAQDARSIWQGDGFTLIHSPVVSGGGMDTYGMEKDEKTSNAKVSQSLMIEVTGSVVSVYKTDITSGRYIGQPYVFDTADTSTFKYTDERESIAKASEQNKPYFPENAEVSVSDVTGSAAKITFPSADKDGESAEGLQDSFVQYYGVKIKNNKTGEYVKENKLLGDFWLPAEERRAQRSTSVSNLSRNTSYTAEVTAYSSFSQASEVLTASFKTTADKSDADLALTKKTDSVNVALGKPVTASENLVPYENWDWSRLTDGNAATIVAPTMDSRSDSDNLTVDLGKRYSIDKINIVSAANDDMGRIQVEIQAANNADFSDAVTLDSINAFYDETKFPKNGTWTIYTDGRNAYRYVRIQKTASAFWMYGDLEVYASEYITEVSRNKPVEASIAVYANNKPEYAVDGKNDSTNTGWWSAYPGVGGGKYNTFGTDEIGDYLTVDLEESLPISYIEIEYPNGISDNVASRQGWSVYGSNSLPAKTETSPLYRPQLAVIGSINADGFTELCTTGVNNYIPVYSVEKIVGMSGNLYNAEGTISQKVDSGTPYRYITFKKLNKNIAQLGEVRAYVTNPTLGSIKKDGENIILSFSDEMDASTLTAENIKIFAANGDEITGFEVSASGYEAVISGAGKAAKITLGYGVKNEKGAELAGEMTKYIESELNLSGKPVITVNRNVALGKKVTGVNIDAPYTEDKLTDGHTGPVDNDSVNSLCALAGKSGASATIDLGRRYNISKLVLHSRKDGVDEVNGRKNFVILGSNDAEFKTSDELGGIGELNEELFPNKGEYVKEHAGDKAYRYIRLAKTAPEWSLFSELEVYADSKLTEVSRNAAAYATADAYGRTPDKAVDGKNSTDSDAWWSGYNATDDALWIDLGSTFPIEMVEIQSSAVDDNSASRGQWTVYGSNTVTNDTSKLVLGSTAAAENYLNIEGYSIIADLGWYYIPYYNKGETDTVYNIRSDSSAANYQSKGIAREWLGGKNSYRYITFKHRAPQLSALGEVKVYTAVPMALGVTEQDGTVTVSFSDSMFPHLLNASKIKLLDSNGEEVAQSNIKVGETEYTFDADLAAGKEYTVVAAADIKNVESIPLGEEARFAFRAGGEAATDIVLENITAEGAASAAEMEAGQTYKITADMVSGLETAENIKIIIAQKAGTRLAAVNIIETAAQTKQIEAQITAAADIDGIEIFVWSGNMKPLSGKYTY